MADTSSSRDPSEASPHSLCSDDFAEFLEQPELPERTNSAATTSSCPHPGYLAGMCIRCGEEKPKTDETEGTLLPLKYVHQGLEFSVEEMQRLTDLRTVEAERRGKLQLVLDLDHTLLHSVPLDYAASLPGLKEWLLAEAQAEPGQRTLYEVPACLSFTKLRPGVFQFLRALKETYEMHIYTMGEENYAAEMAKLLDPDGSFFRKRVISREHSSTPMTKNLDIVMGSDRSTVIVDDTWQVWRQHTRNLLTAGRYVFFPIAPTDAGVVTPNWLELRADECGVTGELSRIQSTLQRIHAAYFAASGDDRDVRTVMKSLLQRKRSRSMDG